MYKIFWKEGVPHVDSGVVVLTGKVKKRKVVQFPGTCIGVTYCEPSIEEAINREAAACCFAYGNPHKMRPWTLLRVIAKLARLRKKLRALHLVS